MFMVIRPRHGIPFCNLRYDAIVELRLFNVLSGHIRKITNTYGTIPDFITDEWVKTMLTGKAFGANEIVIIVTDRPRSPFTVKETYEYLDEQWEDTAEVLNSKKDMNLFFRGGVIYHLGAGSHADQDCFINARNRPCS
jgi:hypothetical protein